MMLLVGVVALAAVIAGLYAVALRNMGWLRGR
jgi:hypothetical protein